MKLKFKFKLLAIMAALLSLSAQAEGVLDRVKATGKLVIAHRASSVPFSYVLDGKPVGYALDICNRVAAAVQREAGLKAMAVTYLPITPENRIEKIVRGEADMECGSTINTRERRGKVAFSIPYFIDGVRFLVRSDSGINGIEDLGKPGKKTVSTAGTVVLENIRTANEKRGLGLTIITAPDHAQSTVMVEKRQADGFVMLETVLVGLKASRPDPAALKLVGKRLSIEPIAIMLPKGDAAFKRVVDDEMRRLIYNHEIEALYDKWFMKPIPPNNKPLNLPVSYLLRDSWRYPSDFAPD